jgi:hypothetical protein
LDFIKGREFLDQMYALASEEGQLHLVNSFSTEEVLSSGNASDLYLGGA